MRFSFSYSRVFWTGLAVVVVAWCVHETFAQQQESVKIKPYTGPPIYLDEPEVVVKPTLVRHEKLEEKFPDGKPRIEREVAIYSDNNFEADGLFREYYPNGQLFVEGQYRKGRQHGEWTYYYDNGQLNRKANYVDGQPDGQWEVYRADGTLAAKRSFRNGQRHGDWIVYDSTGKQPLREEHYDNGKVDGVWKYWYPNGQMKQQLSFRQGERQGTSIEWDEKGQKRVEVNYQNNKLHGTATRWLPDGRRVVQQYQEGRLESQSTE